MKKKILFIFHEDTKTGAPTALLSFLNFIKQNHPNEFVIDIYVLRSIQGELLPELRKISRNLYVKKKDKSIKTKVTNLFKPIALQLQLLQSLHKYDIVYGNTILTLKYLKKLKQQNTKLKTILHVHEGNFLCQNFLNQKNATADFKYIDQIFTVTKSTKQNLIENYEVTAEKISFFPPTTNQNEYSSLHNPLKETYKNYDLVLVNIGKPSLTKGTDLIPQIATHLRNQVPNLNFKILIVGNENDDSFLKILKFDVTKLNLNDCIEFIPKTEKSLDYIAIAHACIITSREESFSLVGAEAIKLNKPLIFFRNAIGLAEYLSEESTFQAEYLNTQDFANEILKMYNSPEITQQKIKLNEEFYRTEITSEICNQKHYTELKKHLH